MAPIPVKKKKGGSEKTHQKSDPVTNKQRLELNLENRAFLMSEFWEKTSFEINSS